MYDAKKSGCLDDDDKEHKGRRDLEYMLEEVSENDEDYYEPERVNNALRVNIGNMKVEEVNIMNH